MKKESSFNIKEGFDYHFKYDTIGDGFIDKFFLLMPMLLGGCATGISEIQTAEADIKHMIIALEIEKESGMSAESEFIREEDIKNKRITSAMEALASGVRRVMSSRPMIDKVDANGNIVKEYIPFTATMKTFLPKESWLLVDGKDKYNLTWELIESNQIFEIQSIRGTKLTISDLVLNLFFQYILKGGIQHFFNMPLDLTALLQGTVPAETLEHLQEIWKSRK